MKKKVITAITEFPEMKRGEFHYYQNSNLIRKKIKELLLSAGYGKTEPDIPFSDIIKPGMTVLLKPNWVHHINLQNTGMECMITQPEFILAVLQEVLNTKPGKVIIGDAPIQGCQFNKLIDDRFLKTVEKMAPNGQVQILDFRQNKFEQNGIPTVIKNKDRDIDDYLLFDLKQDSLLDDISIPQGHFRVTMYDYKKLAQTHKPGRHQYLLCKEAFTSNVIINLPKLKTHRKAGMTAALKNLVGLNGSKDFLPHHRVGGSFVNGDCYYGWSPLKNIAEKNLDKANTHIGSEEYLFWTNRFSKIMRVINKIGNPEIEGGWYGNDTIWRTVLDLNRILLYGTSDGTMADIPQRQIFSITDAIITGEGNGPLEPSPLYRGVITFTNNSLIVDALHAILLGFDPNKIPMINKGFSDFRWPINNDININQITTFFKDQELTILQFKEKFAGHCLPPNGWQGHCEL